MEKVKQALKTLYNGNPNDVEKEFYILSIVVKLNDLYKKSLAYFTHQELFGELTAQEKKELRNINDLIINYEKDLSLLLEDK
jgi:hypothetical protein